MGTGGERRGNKTLKNFAHDKRVSKKESGP